MHTSAACYLWNQIWIQNAQLLLGFSSRSDTVREEAVYLTKLLCSLLIVIIQGKRFEVTA